MLMYKGAKLHEKFHFRCAKCVCCKKKRKIKKIFSFFFNSVLLEKKNVYLPAY